MAQVLIVDDDEITCRLVSQIVTEVGHENDYALTLTSGLERVSLGEYDVVFLDITLPDGNGLEALPKFKEALSAPEVIIITGTGNRHGAELAFKGGAWAYIKKPFDFDQVALPLVRALEYRREKRANQEPKVLETRGIIGHSPQIKSCLSRVAQAAGSRANVLITGETGTGKEVFARAIHANSPRAEANFVVVDCTVLPESLVEGVLFGHEKGAFTGADRAREGLIKQADGGTLFLDEVGELPYAIQKAFLRVLQERRFRPVGAQGEVASDFRLAAATNRDLDELADQGEFRPDLLFRLQSLTISLPPLRQRAEDISQLVVHYLVRICGYSGLETKGFSPEFLDLLIRYHWPGNVRELINTLEQAIAAAGKAPTLYPNHLPPAIRLTQVHYPEEDQEEVAPEEEAVDFSGMAPTLREYREAAMTAAEDRYLRQIMRQAKGSIKEARRLAGLSESRLHALLKKYETPRPRTG